MNDNKKKRYPTDRIKLHTILKKKEEALKELRAEVEELRRLVKQADNAAISETADLYCLTPEKLKEIMKSMFGEPPKPHSEAFKNGATPTASEKEEDSTDDEKA